MWASIPLKGGILASRCTLLNGEWPPEILGCLWVCISAFIFESCEYLLFYSIYPPPPHIQRGAGTAHKKQNNKEIYSKLPAKNVSGIYNHPQKTDATTERKE